MSPLEKKKRKKKNKKTAKKEPLLNPSPELLPPTQQSTLNSSLPLPYDLQLTCLARLSRSYYPTLSLVSKTFRSLLASPELYKTRSLLNHTESCLYVCLKLPLDDNPRWFTLCRKPNRLKKTTNGNILLPVPFPESASPAQTSSFVAVGSYIYEIGGLINDEPSTNVSILDCRCLTRNQAPNMLLARKNPSAYAIDDGNIYVLGGLEDFKSTNYYKDVFDLKTQTWKSESTRGANNNVKETIYIPHFYRLLKSYYNLLSKKQILLSFCVINNLFLSYKDEEFSWYDAKAIEWRVLKGMEGQLPKLSRACDVQLADYGGKMAVLWHNHDCSSKYKGRIIWCAVIVLERYNSEEISGKVEWIDPVLKVPELFRFVSVLAATV